MRNLPSHLQLRLEAMLAEGAHATRLSDAVVALWTDVAAVLSPIIGTLGVAALFRRALSLSVAEFPALASLPEDTSPANDFAALGAALGRHSGAESMKCNEALLRNFLELLSTLIGGPLTERLINHVPGIASSTDPPQETLK